MYRPAVDLQDYEMVELFLRRLKMWMGLSRAKEVRLAFQLFGFHVTDTMLESMFHSLSISSPAVPAQGAFRRHGPAPLTILLN